MMHSITRHEPHPADDGAVAAADAQIDHEAFTPDTFAQDTFANPWVMAAIGLATMLYAIALSGALNGAAAFP